MTLKIAARLIILKELAMKLEQDFEIFMASSKDQMDLTNKEYDILQSIWHDVVRVSQGFQEL